MAGNKTTLTQRLTQKQTLTQTLTPLQVMVVRLTEMPLESLGKEIENQTLSNPFLESNGQGGSSTPSKAEDTSRESDAPDSYDDNDDIPPMPNNGYEGSPRELGDNVESLFDHLESQIGEYELTEHEEEVVRYLIGSLNGDGFMDVPVYQLCMEMDVNEDIQTENDEVERLLTTVVQHMDPIGVGARSIQECLVLQASHNYKGEARKQLASLFSNYWDDFTHSRWKKIQLALKLDDVELQNLRKRVLRLNPRPGRGFSNGSEGDNRTVIPDFRVTRKEDGNLHLELNEGDLPSLVLSPDAEITMTMPAVSKAEQKALTFMRKRVGDAKMFIDAIRQRRESMLKTMKAIVKLQRTFFLTGDETRLVPMTMEDVSSLTGLDIATTSRVAKDKYVETDYGNFSLRWFFNSAAVKDGDEVSVRMILSALQKVVDEEDKEHPLSDDAIAEALKKQGFTVARRTVAKYRKRLNIAESRMRKQ